VPALTVPAQKKHEKAAANRWCFKVFILDYILVFKLLCYYSPADISGVHLLDQNNTSHKTLIFKRLIS